ncbi:MAG: hypothetical protein PVF74_14025 [Anaerolineales bacterium]
MALSESKNKKMKSKEKKDPVAYSLEIIYLAGKQEALDNPKKWSQEERQLKAAKTLRLRDELRNRGLPEDVNPFHSRSGLPRKSSMEGYAKVHDTLVELKVIESRTDDTLISRYFPNGKRPAKPKTKEVSAGRIPPPPKGAGPTGRLPTRTKKISKPLDTTPALPEIDYLTRRSLSKQEKRDLIAKLDDIESELQSVKMELCGDGLFSPAYRAVQTGKGLTEGEKSDLIAEIYDIEAELRMLACFLIRRARYIQRADPEIARIMMECLTSATNELDNLVSRMGEIID